MAKPGCDDDGPIPGDVRVPKDQTIRPVALSVIRVENGWLVTVFFDPEHRTKARHVASSPRDVGAIVTGLLAKPDYDWIPEL